MQTQRIAVAIVVLSGAAAAAGMTEAEKKEGLAQLTRTRAGVVEAVKSLSDTQLTFKPAPGRWSIAEILEHITLAEDLLLDYVSQKVMQAPPGKPDRDYQSVDRKVPVVIADRTHKVQAPDPLVPTGRWPPQESLDRFLKGRARTMEFLESTPGLRDHVADSPIGPLDAYQWLLYASAHSERHTRQILEVKADPGFPKE